MVTWRNGDWEVACEPQGGRLARLAWRGTNLLTEPHLPGGVFTPPAAEWGEYETRPIYGYDDCWPSLEVSAWPGRERMVRDHGELCWLAWDATVTDEALTATVCDPEGAWTFTRQVSVVEAALRCDFAATNTGAEAFPMTWAGHALVPPQRVSDLELPPAAKLRQDWPVASPGAAPVTVAEVWPWLRSQSEAVMLVLERCAEPTVRWVQDGRRCALTFAAPVTPSLALWYNPGAYPPGAGLARQEFGIEWLLTPECLVQDAVAGGTAIVLAPGETYRWTVTWNIEEKP